MREHLAGRLLAALMSRDGTTRPARSQAGAAIEYANELLQQLADVEAKENAEEARRREDLPF